MKKTGFALLTALFLSGTLYAQKNNQGTDDFIHSTYSVGGSLKSIQEIKCSNYEQFQFIYLMATPRWNTVDFDQSQKVINEKCIVNHRYGTEQKGEVFVPDLIAKAQKGGTKVLLSFAGEGFNQIVEVDSRRQKFITMMIGFIEKYGYDGIEIDWETGVELPLHATLMVEIRTALNQLEKTAKKKLYLTTALHYFQRYSQELANQVAPHVDWINIMTYDMGGGIWASVPTHNTPLAEIQSALENWKVFSPQQLCIGLANYGFRYKGINPGDKIEGKLEKYGRYFSYNDFLPLLNQGWTEEPDAKEHVSYYFSPDRSEFITMENPSTILTKIEWIKSQGYKGVFWWEFHYDFNLPQSGKGYGTHHLIDVVTNFLNQQQ